MKGELESGRQPFFFAVGFWKPHAHFNAPKKYWELYDPGDIQPPAPLHPPKDVPKIALHDGREISRAFKERPGGKPTAVDALALRRGYYAATSYVDAQVGKVLDELDRLGLRGSTIVVLWSDHGYHLGEKLISGKNTLWDRSTRVPLIFAGPGVTAGAKSRRPAELLDIYPTLVQLAGLPKKSGLEGLSLVPQLRDAEAPRDRPAITTHNHGNHGVRSESWRYIRYADGSEELYDVRSDPNEWRNLAGDPQMTGVLDEHRRWLPPRSAKPAPGSRHRILTYEDGVAVWEGEEIDPNDPVPEI